MILGPLALVAASAFASAAFYINAVEQPARIDLEPGALLAEWKLSYKRATVMQVALALSGAGFGIAAFATTKEWLWLLGALTLVSVIPYTLLVVLPTNRRLMALPTGAQDASIRPDMVLWGKLHGVRTALSLAAVLVYLWASV